jgi:hypothetical protein
MGFRVSIEGLNGETPKPYEALNFSVEEAATPLAAGDSTGQVGTFTVSISTPNLAGSSRSVNQILQTIGPSYLIGHDIRIFDSKKGFTLGAIDTANISRDGGTLSFSGTSRMGELNVFGIQAQPFTGTLSQAFTYYLGLGGITTDLFVDDEIASRSVVFPGWSGELWFHLKQMAAAQDCDISLVSGVVLLRPIRKRVASSNRDTSRSVSFQTSTLAQAIEIYQYNNTSITNKLVYPPGGWTSDVEVFNVNAGETSEYTVPLSASVSSIQPPVMQTFVEQNHNSSSVYTIVADDGLPVDPTAWVAYGGSFSLTINPDTTSLKLVLVGAVGLPTTSGGPASNFSVALGSDVTGNRYSTLRVLGSGVAFDKQKKTVRTGVPSTKTATEVGVTIDNPFISTTNDLYRAGTRAAKNYSGAVPTLSGTVISVNRRGDSGNATYPTYGTVENELKSTLGGAVTYGGVQTYYLTTLGLSTYESVRQYWFSVFQNNDIDQVFGNVQGARVWDRKTSRWYRVRNAGLNPAEIQISSADDDLTHNDVVLYFAGRTYGSVQATRGTLTYDQDRMAGLIL